MLKSLLYLREKKFTTFLATLTSCLCKLFWLGDDWPITHSAEITWLFAFCDSGMEDQTSVYMLQLLAQAMGTCRNRQSCILHIQFLSHKPKVCFVKFLRRIDSNLTLKRSYSAKAQQRVSQTQGTVARHYIHSKVNVY